MKKHNISWLMAAVLALGLSACSDQLNYDPSVWIPADRNYSFSLSKTQYEFEASTNLTADMTVNATGRWTIKGLPDWLTASATQGEGNQTVKLTAQENTVVASRTAVFMIEMEGIGGCTFTRYISAIQRGVTPVLAWSQSTLTVDAKAQTLKLIVNTNCDNVAVRSTNNHFQVTYDAGSNSVTIKMDENTDKSPISGNIILSSPDFSGQASLSLQQNAPTLMMDTSLMSFDQQGGTKSVTISADVDWQLQADSNWVNLSATSGSVGKTNVNVKVSDYSAFTERTAKVSLKNKAGTVFWTLEITQTGITPVLAWNIESYTTDANAKTIELPIVTNCKDAKVTSSNSHFKAELDYAKAIVKVTMSENQTAGDLTTTLKLESADYKNGKPSITLTQSSAKFSANKSELNFTAFGGTDGFSISSDVPWQLQCSEWLTATPSDGKPGEANITVGVPPVSGNSPREGFVQVQNKAGQTFKTVTIKQAGDEIKTETTSLRFSAKNPTAQTIQLFATTDWQVLMKPDWVEVSPTSGSRSESLQNISVTAAESESINGKSGILKIGNEALGMMVEITLTQDGLPFSVDSNLLMFPWTRTTLPIMLDVPGDWEAHPSKGWLSLSDYFGKGEKQIDVTAERNDSEESRSGEISIKSEDKELKVDVVQEGQYLKIANDAAVVPASGGKATLSVTSTVGVKTSESYSGYGSGWVTTSETSSANTDGSVTTLFELSAATSDSSLDREFVLAIIPEADEVSEECAQGVKFTLTQSGRILSTDVNEITFMKEGGTTQTYTVTAEGARIITKEGNWFTLNTDSDYTRFSVTASPYNSGMDYRRGTIKIALKDLPGDEKKEIIITVLQFPKENQFYLNGFTDEEDWNQKQKPNISGEGYGSEENWNQGQKPNISGSGFEAEEEW